MIILGLEKLSLVDYEGHMCATIFTGGCNFRCPFCHNSGLVNQEVEQIMESEVLEYLNKRKGILDSVTISGGEPTLQPDLDVFIRKVKDLGFFVKLDTNGTRPEVLKMLIDNKLLDYVAMDVKNNFDEYQAISGVVKPSIDKIKESLDVLKNSGIDYELRTTLVKEYHKENNIISLSKDLEGHKRLYLQKFVDSGSCISGGLSEINKNDALKFKGILEKTIEKVVLRGY